MALGVYLAAYSTSSQLPVAQSALTTFTIASGLLLIPFVAPPVRALVGGSGLAGDWRPSLLALELLVGYAALLAIPPLRAFFDLTALDNRSYLFIGLAALAWAVIVRCAWRARLLERFLQLDWRDI